MEKEYLQNEKCIHLNGSTRIIQYHMHVLFEFK